MADPLVGKRERPHRIKQLILIVLKRYGSEEKGKMVMQTQQLIKYREDEHNIRLAGQCDGHNGQEEHKTLPNHFTSKDALRF